MGDTNSLEKIVISGLLSSKDNYELFDKIGNREAFSPTGTLIYNAIGEYYGDDPDVRDVNRDLIEARVLRKLPNSKHHGAVGQYFRDLPSGVSGAAIAKDIRELHRAAVGGKLSLALANGSNQEDIARLIAEYQKGDGGQSSGQSGVDFIDVLDTTDLREEKSDVELIKLWPRQLNDTIGGGATRGHHVLVFARPEAGKSLFAINLVCGFLFQGYNVLYLGNEDPTFDIRDRIRGRLLKVSKASVRGERGGSADKLDTVARGVGRVRLGGAAATFADTRRVLAKFSTTEEAIDIVVFDQVRNMRIASDSRTSELEAVGIAARAIAKELNVLVVSITQAGDSATNKVYLEMSDVDSSKTGLPASADLMVGLGADQAMKVNGLMGISLPKNKLSGDHARFTVSVDYNTGVIS